MNQYAGWKSFITSNNILSIKEVFKIGAVVQNWGEELKSGAERAFYGLIQLLDDRFDITVYTSVKSQAPETTIGRFGCKIKVRKFEFIFDKPLFEDEELERIAKKISKYIIPTVREEELFFRNFYTSQQLLDQLRRDVPSLDLVLVTPYIFGAGIFASIEFGRKVVMIPCYHEEHFTKLNLVNLAWKRVKGFICNSDFEASRLREISGNPRCYVVGVPMEVKPSETKVSFDDSRLVFIGRKVFEKGISELINFVKYYNEAYKAALELVFVGPGKLPPSTDANYSWVLDIEDATEEQKLALLSGSLALVQPSKNESFSIVIMESWLQGVPVIVNSNCEVTKSFVERAQGGFHVNSLQEFIVAINLLRERSELRKRLGENGRRFVLANFSQEAVKKRFTEALLAFLKE